MPLPEPVRLDRRLSHLAHDAVPGIENATTTHYRRTISVAGDPGVIAIDADPRGDVRLVAHLPRLEGLMHLVDRVQRLLAGRAWDPFEARIRAIVAAEAGPAAPAALAAADLRGIGVGAAGARAIRDQCSSWPAGAPVPRPS
ncbi:AlkA N-terminal domain-containing protein [Nocardia sp. alder85J]|uniref:AlkA N-terminal domain-containing protein n=1 Tax=Nocardia sp. alder85J TaxID=2862949 RepID=UPI0022588F44|nr:AlkA N-terminal domain-containing protein [Nocardia sp. alder85J]MCX4096307.1 hypothetical protein [Nocardia sp. alder85J]